MYSSLEADLEQYLKSLGIIYDEPGAIIEHVKSVGFNSPEEFYDYIMSVGYDRYLNSFATLEKYYDDNGIERKYEFDTNNHQKPKVAYFKWLQTGQKYYFSPGHDMSERDALKNAIFYIGADYFNETPSNINNNGGQRKLPPLSATDLGRDLWNRGIAHIGLYFNSNGREIPILYHNKHTSTRNNYLGDILGSLDIIYDSPKKKLPDSVNSVWFRNGKHGINHIFPIGDRASQVQALNKVFKEIGDKEMEKEDKRKNKSSKLGEIIKVIGKEALKNSKGNRKKPNHKKPKQSFSAENSSDEEPEVRNVLYIPPDEPVEYGFNLPTEKDIVNIDYRLPPEDIIYSPPDLPPYEVEIEDIQTWPIDDPNIEDPIFEEGEGYYGADEVAENETATRSNLKDKAYKERYDAEMNKDLETSKLMYALRKKALGPANLINNQPLVYYNNHAMNFNYPYIDQLLHYEKTLTELPQNRIKNILLNNPYSHIGGANISDLQETDNLPNEIHDILQYKINSRSYGYVNSDCGC